MAKIRYRAVVMDYSGEGENTYEFEADEDILHLPVDEIVEVLMHDIDRRNILNEPVRYELNAASRFPDKHLVGAMGSLLLKDGSKVPFIALIGPA